MKDSLYQKLTEYAAKDKVAMHMPGHKRNGFQMVNPYSIDITEIDGFDNLHNPSGIIASEQKRLADLYGADDAYILVNGSSCGNLAAVYAAVDSGDIVAIQAKSHKSVYNAIEISKAKTKFLDNEKNYEGVKAVVVTSPDYNGYVSDIKKIANEVHKAGAVLIVDSAHGAHLGFSDKFPDNPINLGADAVIVSLHKTLPSLTQTAALLLKGDRIDRLKIRHALEIFETSSPSYVLMASVSQCLDYLSDRKTAKEIMDVYFEELCTFYNNVADLKTMTVISEDALKKDPSKIIIRSKIAGLTGKNMADDLRSIYGIEIEMTGKTEILALSSLVDAKKLKILSNALIEMDKRYLAILDNKDYFEKIEAQIKEKIALYKELLAGFTGKESNSMVLIYPPGSPVVLSGEEVTKEKIEMIAEAKAYDLEVTGLTKEGLLFVK